MRIRSWGSVADGTTFTNYFRPGQVLFGKRRAYQRKVAVADFKGVCSGDIYVFEPKDGNLLPELLPFICQTDAFFEHAVGTSAGSLSPRTNWKQLAEWEFALPPLEEQKEQADLLWASVETETALQETNWQVHRLWQSVAAKLFSMATFTSGGTTRRLGELLSYASDGPFGSKLKSEHYTNQGVRVVRLQNIAELEFDDSDEAYVSYDYYREQLTANTVLSGDVLIAGLGDESVRVGRACIAPEQILPAVNKADCFCLRTSQELEPLYLVFFLNSPQGFQQSMAFAQGTTRLRLNLGNIKRMQVPLPPLKTQVRIVKDLNKILGAKKQAIVHTAAHQETRKRLLSNVFEEAHV